ncbi:MAG: serine hydrolase, partial [Angelakisella sp.]
MNEAKINKLFKRIACSKSIYEATLFIENTTGDFTLCKEYNRTIDSPMLMASITKLFTTTCILAMLQEKKLSLQDKISQYLNHEAIKKLHIYKNKDYSSAITIANLLFQTSGLPDFYLDGVGSVFSKVKESDFSFTFDDELIWTKSMKPRFAPVSPKKAYYADINFDLLGKIIENVLQCSLQQAFERYIFNPLGLKNTYLAGTAEDFVPHTYYKSQRLERPMFIRSCFASGGAVTTARELMLFMKAFYT